MLFRVRFDDDTKIRITAPDLTAARERVQHFFGPDHCTIEPLDPADPETREAEELLADGRPEQGSR